jgi:hypothetical protein
LLNISCTIASLILTLACIRNHLSAAFFPLWPQSLQSFLTLSTQCTILNQTMKFSPYEGALIPVDRNWF